MRITRTSLISGEQHTMDLPVTEAQMFDLGNANRGLIQDILPDLTDEQREFILTGITPEEWAAAFPAGDEEDDE
jgi:hypothetical protein